MKKFAQERKNIFQFVLVDILKKKGVKIKMGKIKKLGVGMLGYAFMGKAHTNGYKKLPYFVEPITAIPVLKGICGRNEENLKKAAEKFGYEYYTTNWKDLISDKSIDIFDNNGPNIMHKEPCIAALKARKHTIVEKPMAMNLVEAEQMYETALIAEKEGIKSMVSFSNRFSPALLLARRLIKEGKIGQIYHFRAAFLQDWLIDPKFPLVWRLRKEIAGSGVHGDLNAHSIDIARFLTNLEIKRVIGWDKTFIKKRPLPTEASGLSGKGGNEFGEVTVEDAALMWMEFDNGAIGSLEASRFSTGAKSFWQVEVNGSKGALTFNLTRNNELHYYSSVDPLYAQGFKKIIVTEAGEHDFIDSYWPPGHMLGWEANHANTIFFFVDCIVNNKDIGSKGATFYDGLKCQAVLEAAKESMQNNSRWVNVKEF